MAEYQFFITEGLKGLEEFSELMLILSGLKIIIPKLEVSLLSDKSLLLSACHFISFVG